MTGDRPVFVVMQEILVDALGVEESEVNLESKLVSDLGAESIDILDISFRIEEEYDVSLPTKEWTELFSTQSGQLEPADLADHVKNDFGVSFTPEQLEPYADQPLGSILDQMEQDHDIQIPEERRLHYADLGTRALVEGFGDLLYAPIDGEVREEIIRAASECGFDEQFWGAVSSVFTVSPEGRSE